MKKLLLTAMIALTLVPASAYGGHYLNCDYVKSPGPWHPECLGYNPYYVPPGRTTPVGYGHALKGGPHWSSRRISP